MGLGRHLVGHRHTHGHGRGEGHGGAHGRGEGHGGAHSRGEGHGGAHGGGLIRRAGAYDLFTRMALAGRRGRVYAGLAELASIVPGEAALDLGCGTGALTRALGAAVGPSGRVVGIDPSPEMVAYAARRSLAQVTYTVHSAEDLPFGPEGFDVVASALAVPHIDAEARPTALAEAARVLRPGGRLLLVDFQPPRGRAARAVVRALTGPQMADNDPAAELVGLCVGAGLRVVGQGHRSPVFGWVLAVKG